jgi:hypothetical protein
MDAMAEVSTNVIDREPSHISGTGEDEFADGLVGNSSDLALSDLRRAGLMANDLKSAMVVPPWLAVEVIFFGIFVDVTYGVAICYILHNFLLCKYGQSATLIFLTYAKILVMLDELSKQMWDISQRKVAKRGRIIEKCYIQFFFCTIDDFFHHNFETLIDYRKICWKSMLHA